MTISGGVSLGIYEAGVNWAIIETLRQSGRYKLQSVTGASAGAVNIVLTGLRYCEADVDDSDKTPINNLFYRAWNVQLADLLPPRDDYGKLELGGVGGPNDTTVLEDSIFSRSVYAERLMEISNQVKNGKYRNGCVVDLAIVVSRVEPEFRTFGSGDGKIQVPGQRYVIPLSLVVEGNSDVVTGISFRNNLRYSRYPERSSNYLYLPESDGTVSFDNVARAVMASSAFPLAFAPVEMSYCVPGPKSGGNTDGSICPPDHSLDANYFVDGGVFDNVPVGVAVDLVNAREAATRQHAPHSYIFLNPESEAGDYSADRGSGVDYTFEGQLESLLPLLTTQRKKVLTNALTANFGSVDAPQLFLTRRTLPIVGTYLQNFGAFFDKGFFFHDYAAGIHDGITSVVEFLCSDSVQPDSDHECNEGPESLQKRLLSELVLEPLEGLAQNGLDDCEPAACDAEIHLKLMKAFNTVSRSIEGGSESSCNTDEEFMPDGSAGYVNQTLSVFVALCENRHKRFEALIVALDNQRTSESGLFKKRKWLYGDEVEFIAGKRLSPWTFGFLEKSLQRLLDLETKYEGTSANTFSAAWAMMPGSETGNQAVLQRNRVLAHLSPDYIGIDGLQSGVAVSWDWALPLPEVNCRAFSRTGILLSYCENYRVMVGAGAHFRRVVNERDRFNTTSAFIGIDFSRPDSFLHSSSGVRLVRNADYLPFVDHDNNFESYNSIELYSRFFGNKIEVSLGFEGNSLSFGQDDLRLRIGLNDVDRFLALMCPACF